MMLSQSFQDRSPVSLTGRYTGEVWVRNGLSPAGFSTKTGRLLQHLVQPLDQLVDGMLGVSLETQLRQRHELIDWLLEGYAYRFPNLQIVEIASGLSARAVRLLGKVKSDQLTYIEADLPDVARHKQQLLLDTGFKDARHQVVSCNILRRDGPLSPEALLSSLDQARPLVVITEGLVNYFSLPVIEDFWARLVLEMKDFPKGIYIADVWPRLPQYAAGGLRLLRTGAIRGIEWLTRQSVPLHFEAEADMQQGFQKVGFSAIQIHNPEMDKADYRLPRMRQPSMFRVVEAIV